MKKLSFLFLLLLISCISNYKAEKAIELADQLFNEENIFEIDDCTRSNKYLNNIRISIDKQVRFPNKETYYKDILKQEGVSEQKFNYYKNKLNDTGLRSYLKVDDYSFFILGGALGDINGIVVIHNNAKIPSDGMKLDHFHFVYFGKKIHKNAYYFTG